MPSTTSPNTGLWM